jgi:hypothetical protein
LSRAGSFLIFGELKLLLGEECDTLFLGCSSSRFQRSLGSLISFLTLLHNLLTGLLSCQISFSILFLQRTAMELLLLFRPAFFFLPLLLCDAFQLKIFLKILSPLQTFLVRRLLLRALFLLLLLSRHNCRILPARIYKRGWWTLLSSDFKNVHNPFQGQRALEPYIFIILHSLYLHAQAKMQLFEVLGIVGVFFGTGRGRSDAHRESLLIYLLNDRGSSRYFCIYNGLDDNTTSSRKMSD